MSRLAPVGQDLAWAHGMWGAANVFATTGVPYYFGSNAWAVAPSRSADSSTLLVGGPQIGYTIPQIVLEVGLVGADIPSVGMTFAGV